LPDRDDFIIDDDDNNDNNNAQSDLVRIVLSLSYIQPHRINEFKLLSADGLMKQAKDPEGTQKLIDQLNSP